MNGEPAEGELLAVRLRRETLTPNEALQYALQIGAALSEAHARGMVHGRLSPHSIALTDHGAVLLRPVLGPAVLPYRAPEQVLGAPADELSDIFAFGSLLYQMISADPPFTGEGVDLNAAILGTEPLPIYTYSTTFASMKRVMASCMVKDRAKRLQHVSIALHDLGSTATGAAGKNAADPDSWRPRASVRPVAAPQRRRVASGRSKRPSGKRAGLLVSALLAICAVGLAGMLLLPARRPAQSYRFTFNADDAQNPGMPVVSPDGRYVVWCAVGPDGARKLWLRPLRTGQAKPIAGSEGAWAPFWSPDSSYVAFFAGGALDKIRVTNGAAAGKPIRICPAGDPAGGGAWNEDGVILFAPDFKGGLWRVPASGGVPQQMTHPDLGRAERAHLWPQFLSDGKRFVFFVAADEKDRTGIYTASLDSPDSNLLLKSESSAAYSGAGSSGHLFFIRDGSLMAQALTSKAQLSGEPALVASNVKPLETLRLTQASASGNGALVFESAGEPERQLTWYDRSGKPVGTLGASGDWGPARISPDGRRVAVARRAENSGHPELWVVNTADGSGYQLTHSTRGAAQPVWSPDGNQVAFASDDLGEFNLYIQPADQGSKAELAYRDSYRKAFDDWSSDGRTMLFDAFLPGLNRGLYRLASGSSKTVPVLDTIHSEGFAALSPDGDWVAYQSDESGFPEVVVQTFDNGAPGTKRVYAISKSGGGMPRWRRDGHELYYIDQRGRLFAAAVHPSGKEFSFDAPRELFQTRAGAKSWNLFDVSPAGDRFLVNALAEWPKRAQVEAIVNWSQERN